jgi:hypothetical protein
MFPNNMEFMASEHRQDLMQEAEQVRLLKAAGVRQPDYFGSVKNVARWLGGLLIKWGAKLQGYSTAPLAEVTENVGAG